MPLSQTEIGIPSRAWAINKLALGAATSVLGIDVQLGRITRVGSSQRRPGPLGSASALPLGCVLDPCLWHHLRPPRQGGRHQGRRQVNSVTVWQRFSAVALRIQHRFCSWHEPCWLQCRIRYKLVVWIWNALIFWKIRCKDHMFLCPYNLCPLVYRDSKIFLSTNKYTKNDCVIYANWFKDSLVFKSRWIFYQLGLLRSPFGNSINIVNTTIFYK